ncbi:MAG TPA: hypothetical protein VGG19_20275, partial [Tepidisphaeraceae bacterium]
MANKRTIGLVACVLAMAVSAASAQTSHWINTAGGDFAEAANWDNGIPGATGQANFDTGTANPYTVTFNSSVVNSLVNVGGDQVVFDLGGNSYTTTTTGSGSINIGTSGNGSLTILDGSVTGTTAEVGFINGYSNTLSVSGAGSFLTTSNIEVGDGGTGIFNANNGANVNAGSLDIGGASSGGGTVNIDGTGTILSATSISVATNGSGSLNITNGAVVNSTTGYSVIGSRSNGAVIAGTGTVTVSGPGSQWNNSSALYIGDDGGSGTLTIQNGGELTAGEIELGRQPSASGEVDLMDPGSSLLVNGNMSIGAELFGPAAGRGIFNISNGSATIEGGLYINNSTGTLVTLSGGSLTVNGISSLPGNFQWTGGTLNIAASGLTIGSGYALGSSVTLNSGMTLTTSGTGQILVSAGSILTLNGGTIPGSANIYSMPTSTIDLATGTFTRSSSETLGGDFINHGSVAGPTTSGQSLTFTGGVSGSGSFTGNIVFDGSFSPGNTGPATISLANASFWAANNLEIDVDGASSLDHLNFSGAAVLGGTLTVDLGNGFVPALNQNFDLFDGPTSGTFHTLSLAALPLALTWNTSQLYSNGILSIVSSNQWGAASSGTFQDSTRWSAGSSPAILDEALFNTGSSSGYVVSFSSDAANDHTIVANDKVVFDLQGHRYSLSTITTPSLQVGVNGTGNLTIQSPGGVGTFSTGDAFVAVNPGDTGIINVNDAHATWSAQNIFVGGSSMAAGGAGVLNVGGGTVSAASLKVWDTVGSAINLSGGTLSVATLDLTSTPSLLNWTGGILQITQGGITIAPDGNLPANLTVNNKMALQLTAPTTDLIVQSGAQSFTIDAGSVTVANGGIDVNGSSSVYVKGGGQLLSKVANIGNDSSGLSAIAIVEDAGSNWTNKNAIDVGAENGELNIESGGTVNSQSMNIAEGSVSVDGAGSQLNLTAGLIVGDISAGALLISNGGEVSDTTASIGYATTGSGGGRGGGGPVIYSSGIATISGTNSNWTTTGSLYVGGSSAGDAGSGILNVNGGIVTVDGTLKIWKPANTSTSTIVNLAGGTLSVGALDTTSTPANFNWTAGTLNITNSDLHIGSGDPLGSSLTLASGMNLQVTGALHSLILDTGGTLINSGEVLADNMDITAGTYVSTGTTEILGGNFLGGTHTVGGSFVNLGFVVGPGGAGQYLTFSGDVVGNGVFEGNIAFAGSFTPDDPVSVTFNGPVLFKPGNVLTMDISGSVQGSGYDFLDFLAPATLGGALD